MEEAVENKRIVLINGDTASWFEQAIIIVRDGHALNGFEDGRPTPNLVAQAEKIVNGCNPFRAYQNFAAKPATAPKCHGEPARAAQSKAAASKNSFDSFLNLMMIVGCVVIAGVLITQL